MTGSTCSGPAPRWTDPLVDPTECAPASQLVLTGSGAGARSFALPTYQDGVALGAIQCTLDARGSTRPLDRNSCPDATGAIATLSSSGTTSLRTADLVRQASNVPGRQFRLLILSDTSGLVPGFANSQGNLCVGGSIIRLDAFLQSSGTTGTASLSFPDGTVPSASLDIGETWSFQAWIRDFVNGRATPSSTDGLQIAFAT